MTKVQPFLSQSDTEKLFHVFVTSRTDYCNVLLTGVPKRTIYTPQLVQNAAARILTDLKHRAHISLHCIPVSIRIEFKVLLLVYKALNNLEPAYITERLSVYVPALILELQILAFCTYLSRETLSVTLLLNCRTQFYTSHCFNDFPHSCDQHSQLWPL